MIGIIRYLKGYVKIKVWGYAPQRFMNLCINRGIVLWGLSGYGGYYTMYMSLSDFFSIRDIVGKTKTRVAVLERHGLPFFMRNVRKRKMFAAGIVLCMTFLLVMSRFIWAIQMEGNLLISDEELYHFMQSQGVDYGTKKSGLRPEELEAAIREQFPIVTWTSVRLEGTRVTVMVKENDVPTKEERTQLALRYPDGADLVAAKAGVVADILTRSGVPQVKEGDTVEKGEVLVSGMVPIYSDDGTVREWEHTVADADIRIEYEQNVSLSQNFSYQYKNYTGREKVYRFFAVGGKRYRFPFGTCSYVCYDEILEERQLSVFGQIDLPVFIGNIRYREYLPVDARYDEESARTLLEAKFEKIMDRMKEKGVQIIQKDVKIVRKANALSMEGKITVQQDVSVLQKIAVQKESESESAAP